jgi:4-amino-4-deoxy-L-arabinose transferase-like glycosyltransferase
VVGFLVSGLVQAGRDAPTVDEGIDLASGVTALVRRDLSMTPEHAPLGKLPAALPALAAKPIVPEGEAYRQGDWFDHTDDFISANEDAGRLRRILFLARIVPLLEAIACALLILHLGRRLVGTAGGLLAATLWLTTPVVVGLAHFDMIDVPFTLSALVVATALLAFRERPDLRRAAWLGTACAVTLLTRHTGLVLVGVSAVVVVVTCWPRRRDALRALAVVLLVGWAGLWVGYRAVDPSPRGGPVRERLDGIVGAASDRSAATALVLAVPAPIEWQAGYGYLTLTADARPAYLFGRAWEGSRWWFFPGSILVKVPLGGLLFLLLGPLAWTRLPGDRRRSAGLVLAFPAVVLFVALLTQPLNLGLRLVLPVVALWFAFAAPAVLVRRRSVGRVAVVAVVVSQAVAMLAAGGHALAWNPPPFQPSYRWASDSNVDFGQDMFRLDEWSEGRRPWVAMISTRGLSRPSGSRRLVGADPAEVTGWVAVGVTSLTVVDRDELAWLRAYCPVGSIGGSILLYRFDEPPSSEPGPVRPVAPCDGADVSTRTWSG